jgi:DHA2 family multidrug resistance protein
LITAGALLFAWAMWMLSKVTGESGQSDFFWPLILRGLGLGLMFVPLTTVTLARLSLAELPQGTGLYNFFRQLGGSFGIAALATLLSRYTTQIRSVLGSHVVLGDPASTHRLYLFQQRFMARGADAITAHHQALQVMEMQLQGQASVLAYSRIYILSAALILLLIPLLLLVGKTRRPSSASMILE